MNRQEYLFERMQSEKRWLEGIIAKAGYRIRYAPDGCLRTVNCHGYLQFYERTDPKDKNGKYIPASQKKRVRALLQKKYDLKLLSVAEKQLKVIDRFLSAFDTNKIDDLYYYRIEPEARPYLTEAVLPDKEFAEAWEGVAFVPKPFAPEVPEHYTLRGERVRSRSEVMIADALYQAGVRYRYECPLNLGGILIYPDFTILREQDRKEIYWEHLGMMDDTVYRNDAVSKIRLYEKHGHVIGGSLLVTIESYRCPLNLSSIKALIEYHFQPD